MTTSSSHAHSHDTDREIYDRTLFGFWLYILTDCVMFATLFATYAVLHNNTFGGPSAKDLFSLPFVLLETLVLLTSSFTCGLGMLGVQKKSKSQASIFFSLTLLLGLAFIALEFHEFSQFVQEGHTWQKSAFLSAYFTLVGTHGLHVTFGLLWIAVMLFHLLKRDLNMATTRRFACLSMFWHFLDVIWIFIFTIVYLMGVL